ncbi:hypothetical protein Ddye_016677 [Dipteronia dyeriana]|uniref:Uncharacterized protein n=1 Tax=Dipteronia dyeriana TaxID=168575 RepID=A0AAD9X099_9ROSI|nr:hypothetical protein Ddye_016677 [Dipteronia dyeriana]
MGNSQNRNGKGKGKTDTYQQWTMDTSNLLLGLLAEAMKIGLHDTNGSLSKMIVENFILPHLNAKTRFPKTYSTDSISTNFERIYNLMKKRERQRETERQRD